MHKRGGARSHPGIVSSGWGLSTLRLLWDISRGWTLHHGCSRRQRRRRLSTLSWEAVYGSLGSACCISRRRTDLDPGPKSISSACANHGWRLGCAATACGWDGSDVRQGRLSGVWRGEVQGVRLGHLCSRVAKREWGGLFMVHLGN